MSKYRIETIINGYKVALECDEQSARILLPRFSKGEPNFTNCRAIYGDFALDDQSSTTWPTVVCFVDDLPPLQKEHTYTDDGDGGFLCVRGHSHQFVVSDEDENDCYCQNCGVREW